jgi:hypothetical protein
MGVRYIFSGNYLSAGTCRIFKAALNSGNAPTTVGTSVNESMSRYISPIESFRLNMASLDRRSENFAAANSQDWDDYVEGFEMIIKNAPANHHFGLLQFVWNVEMATRIGNAGYVSDMVPGMVPQIDSSRGWRDTIQTAKAGMASALSFITGASELYAAASDMYNTYVRGEAVSGNRVLIQELDDDYMTITAAQA